MKIVFISEATPFDKQIRSGVIYSIYNQLTKYYEVYWLKPKTGLCYILSIKIFIMLKRLLSVFGKEITVHNPLLSRLLCSDIQKQLRCIDYDAVFSLDCMNIAYLNINKPIYYRTDSSYPLLLNYYVFNTPKLFVKWGCEVEMQMLQRVTKIFSPSLWLNIGILKYFPTTDKNKLVLVESGANIESNNINYRHNYCKSKPLNILFVGFDVKRKGIDIAYETLKELNNKYKIESYLTIIGGKPDDNIIKDSSIIYVGRLNKNNPNDLLRLYNEYGKASLFLFPTKAECHGIVNCEAAAFGLPIFSYETGGVPSYVKNNYNGCVLPITAGGKEFAEKIAESISSGIIKLYSENSRRLYIERFNWDKWGETVYSIIGNNI